MILVAAGDSFIYGSELADQTTSHSLNTFAAQLASTHQLDYQCVAYPGYSNAAISRTAIVKSQQLIENKQEFFVFVSWTFAQRYEFRFTYDTHQQHSPWYSINSWVADASSRTDKFLEFFKNHNNEIAAHHKIHHETALRTGVAEFARTFFKHVGDSEYYEIYSTLKEIVYLQNYLKINNIPYIFHTADNSFYKSDQYRRSKDSTTESLYNQIDWNNWYFFPAGTQANETQIPRGFYQWSVENKYKVGTTHPLEDAHNAATAMIKEKFNEMVKKYN